MYDEKSNLALETTGLYSDGFGHWSRQLWGTGARAPLDLQQFNFFQCTLTYTKSDSDYMLAVTSCKHPCAPLGTTSWRRHWIGVHPNLTNPFDQPLYFVCEGRWDSAMSVVDR